MDQATYDELYNPFQIMKQYEEMGAEIKKVCDEAPKKRETAYFIDGFQVNIHFVGEVTLTIYDYIEMRDRYNRTFNELQVIDSIKISANSVDEVLKAAKAGIKHYNLNDCDFNAMMITEEYTGQYSENISNDIFK